MKYNRKPLAIPLILLLMTGAILAACAYGSPDSPPAVATLDQETRPLPDSPPTAEARRAIENLPPPLIITIPADQLDVAIDGAAAAAGAVTTQGNAGPGLVQFEEGLPADVNALLERIYQGDYLIDTTGQTPGSLPVTFTYSDMNGDGIEDLVIILVVGPGDYSGVTAGSSQGNPVIQIITRPETESVVEGLNIPIDEILAMAGFGATNFPDQGPYLITLAAGDGAALSETVLPE